MKKRKIIAAFTLVAAVFGLLLAPSCNKDLEDRMDVVEGQVATLIKDADDLKTRLGVLETASADYVSRIQALESKTGGMDDLQDAIDEIEAKLNGAYSITGISKSGRTLTINYRDAAGAAQSFVFEDTGSIVSSSKSANGYITTITVDGVDIPLLTGFENNVTGVTFYGSNAKLYVNVGTDDNVAYFAFNTIDGKAPNGQVDANKLTFVSDASYDAVTKSSVPEDAYGFEITGVEAVAGETNVFAVTYAADVYISELNLAEAVYLAYEGANAEVKSDKFSFVPYEAADVEGVISGKVSGVTPGTECTEYNTVYNTYYVSNDIIDSVYVVTTPTADVFKGIKYQFVPVLEEGYSIPAHMDDFYYENGVETGKRPESFLAETLNNQIIDEQVYIYEIVDGGDSAAGVYNKPASLAVARELVTKFLDINAGTVNYNFEPSDTDPVDLANLQAIPAKLAEDAALVNDYTFRPVSQDVISVRQGFTTLDAEALKPVVYTDANRYFYVIYTAKYRHDIKTVNDHTGNQTQDNEDREVVLSNIFGINNNYYDAFETYVTVKPSQVNDPSFNGNWGRTGAVDTALETNPTSGYDEYTYDRIYTGKTYEAIYGLENLPEYDAVNKQFLLYSEYNLATEVHTPYTHINEDVVGESRTHTFALTFNYELSSDVDEEYPASATTYYEIDDAANTINIPTQLSISSEGYVNFDILFANLTQYLRAGTYTAYPILAVDGKAHQFEVKFTFNRPDVTLPSIIFNNGNFAIANNQNKTLQQLGYTLDGKTIKHFVYRKGGDQLGGNGDFSSAANYMAANTPAALNGGAPNGYTLVEKIHASLLTTTTANIFNANQIVGAAQGAKMTLTLIDGSGVRYAFENLNQKYAIAGSLGTVPTTFAISAAPNTSILNTGVIASTGALAKNTNGFTMFTTGMGLRWNQIYDIEMTYEWADGKSETVDTGFKFEFILPYQFYGFKANAQAATPVTQSIERTLQYNNPDNNDFDISYKASLGKPFYVGDEDGANIYWHAEEPTTGDLDVNSGYTIEDWGYDVFTYTDGSNYDMSGFSYEAVYDVLINNTTYQNFQINVDKETDAEGNLIWRDMKVDDLRTEKISLLGFAKGANMNIMTSAAVDGLFRYPSEDTEHLGIDKIFIDAAEDFDVVAAHYYDFGDEYSDEVLVRVKPGASVKQTVHVVITDIYGDTIKKNINVTIEGHNVDAEAATVPTGSAEGPVFE